MNKKTNRSRELDKQFRNEATRQRWDWVHRAISEAKQRNHDDYDQAQPNEPAAPVKSARVLTFRQPV